MKKIWAGNLYVCLLSGDVSVETEDRKKGIVAWEHTKLPDKC